MSEERQRNTHGQAVSLSKSHYLPFRAQPVSDLPLVLASPATALGALLLALSLGLRTPQPGPDAPATATHTVADEAAGEADGGDERPVKRQRSEGTGGMWTAPRPASIA